MEKLDKNKEKISSMFNDIAPKYDFLNHFLSLGIDKRWRKKVIKALSGKKYDKILDIATGTGDLAIDLNKLNPDKIIGIDIAEKMVEIGNRKIKKKKLQEKITLNVGDALNIDFPDKYFDAATCAFGVRNFQNLEVGLAEIYRILNENGKIVVLEFSNPKCKIVSAFYKLYFNNILPFIGKIFSKNNSAYSYLPQSVKTFPNRNNFTEILDNVGFKNTSFKSLTFGIACVYEGTK